MKKLIIVLLLFGFIGTGHSQILLKETKLEYRPESMKLDPVSNTLTIKISEKSYGEFNKDPLAFVKNQFDIQRVLKDNEKEDYDSYQVSFKSTKGHLLANFDGDGDLISSFQKFKNVRLPEDARMQILQQYRDAVITGNKHVAISKGWDVQKEFYKVKLRDGDKTRTVKVNKDRGAITYVGL
ncbi:hypothetical protein HC174_13730 [Salinimicrobium sp. CDJ15-81-2]|nr:hypothetical protein [Salinimicrobium nanhaiense]